MNLAIFFDPLTDEPVALPAASTTLAACTSFFLSTFPDWRTVDLAIIGLDDWRGSAAGPPAAHGANAVRRRFYALQKGSGAINLADLGNLRPGLTLEDTYQRLREIVATLLEHNTVPLLLGGSHDLDYGQFMAYETLNRPISFTTVDARVDMAELPLATPEDNHLRQLLMHAPSFLFNFTQLAHQQYLVSTGVLTALEKLNFERLRLGKMRDDKWKVEPLLRQADFVSFDVAAIRWNDAPAYYPPNPFGLTGEEAAQLCWWAGASPQLTSFGLYGYRPDHDPHGLAASVLATMLWYFVEGYYHRYHEQDFGNRTCFWRFTVSLHAPAELSRIGVPDDEDEERDQRPEHIIFYKSKKTDKWWMEVVNLTGSLRRLVPCGYEDYIEASQGELPDRWVLTQALLEK